MYWADKIAKEIIASNKFKPYWVDDMKTPSGFAHVGSLRGPIIHSLIYRALVHADQKAKFTFVFNDFDPADELPPEFKKELQSHLGEPLKLIPFKKGRFSNLGDLLANDLKETLEALGVEAEYLSSYEMYKEGKFDESIKIALDNAEKIQDIYQKVSGSKKREKGWLPFQAICEKCGKLGTTRVYKWDGKYVYYKCEPELVKWAQGCGHEGKVTPFGGTGKLPWKVDWPAHWKIIGVTIEGAGKDHSTAGGSYDIAMELCKEVFKIDKPFELPYEFFLLGGKKMSSSKGIGLKAHDLTEILPASVARFLFARTNYKEAIDFNPVETMAIPDLFDEYDRAWTEYNKGETTDLARMFEMAQISELPKPNPKLFVPRFRDIVNYKQLPNVDLWAKLEEIKGGKLTKGELDIFKEREKYASIWIGRFAPKDMQMQMSEELPEKIKELTNIQKEYLGNLIPIIERAKGADELQTELFDLVKKMNIPSLEAFAAIYLAFIGKERGPRAAWFLLQYPKEKVIERLKKVTS